MSKFEAVLADWKSDVETIEHLDFEPTINCDLPKIGCENPATWLMRMKCCGATWPACDPCRASYLRWVDKTDATPRVNAKCGTCGHRFPTVADSAEFLPFGKSS